MPPFGVHPAFCTHAPIASIAPTAPLAPGCIFRTRCTPRTFLREYGSVPGVATASRIPLHIRHFPWIKPLVVDYAFDHARVAPFFAGDPRDPHAWREAITRTRLHHRERDAIANIVAAQPHARGAPPEAVAAAARLRNPETVAVVTGQQAGLFGGPLFTLLKALTAIQLAERVRTEHRGPAAGVFWVDAGDHDWDEVKACRVLNGEQALRSVSVGDLPSAHAGP